MATDSSHGAGSVARVGDGDIGGKAKGLVFFRDMLSAEYDPARFDDIAVDVPDFSVITTEMFERVVEGNGLRALAEGDASDGEIGRAFQAVALPEAVRDHLFTVVEKSPYPVAVRSSSLLEDAIFCPFAGVYETKMVPVHRGEPAQRFRRLEEAVKLVWASTYFRGARGYLRAAGRRLDDERMAVILQELVGTPHGDRFYPDLSGVGRSRDFYPAPDSNPEHGVVHLALGLGKTIVDGGVCWCYSPSRPKAPPPYASTSERMKNSQLTFWAMNLAEHDDDPLAEGEHLVRPDLATAESDGVLNMLASTYDARSDRIVPGIGVRGPRVIDFAPLLTLGLLPFNGVVSELLAIGRRAAGADVEIEFAATMPRDGRRARLGFLQVRPMAVAHEEVSVADDELDGDDVVIRSERVMGNGVITGLRDIVYVKPDTFEARRTPVVAAELERLNLLLQDEGRPYVLVGFGRWGSADPWLGIPVDWSQISGAKVIVESTLPTMNVDLSQGAHFFHNINCLGVSYLCVHHEERAGTGIRWDRLRALPAVAEGDFVRHVRLETPLSVRVDGRSRRGLVELG